MIITLFHGYELIGSGSNEYNRYLAKSFLKLGHQVELICREKHPENYPFIDQIVNWKDDLSFERKTIRSNIKCRLHQIPCGPIYPVYLTDKQRPGDVKSFNELSDQELETFIKINTLVLDKLFALFKTDIVFANHLVMQPSLALAACKKYNIPLAFFLHGSAIEYTVKKDSRYREIGRNAVVGADMIVSGNSEVRNRIVDLYPDLEKTIISKTHIVGIGVDTSLFFPIPKSKRHSNINAFISKYCATNTAGKTPEQALAIKQYVSDGNIDKIQTQFDQYQENFLDSDVANKLEKLDTKQPIILFVGALTAGKGLQSLVCAFAMVLEKLPKAQLLIIGSGAYREILEALIYSITTQNDSMLELLSKRGFSLDRSDEEGPWIDIVEFLSIQKNKARIFSNAGNLDTQIQFLGRMDHEQLSYLFPCADIAVFPSARHEAYGLVLMEALANGVFPLVSYFSGFKYGIDELNQFLDASLVDLLKIDMDNKKRIDSIAQQLVNLINLSREKEFSSVLAKIAADNYDWLHKAHELESLFLTYTKAND